MNGPTTAPSLLSDAHGSLRRVLLTVPWWILRYRHHVEFAGIGSAIQGLMTGLPEHTQWVVATRRECRALLDDWLDSLGLAGRVTVALVDDDLTLTCWAQDACVVLAGPDGQAQLMAPTDFDRQDDAHVLTSVAASLGLEHRTSPMSYQGGNILVGDDFWLVGEDAVAETLSLELAPDRDAALAAFSSWLDPVRTLHVVGTGIEVATQESRALDAEQAPGDDGWTEIIRRGSVEGSRQPVFDLDAFISLAGRDDGDRYRLVVGDPSLAADLTGIPLPDHAHPEAFDDIARQLSEAGFQVTRNPLPLAYYDDGPSRTRLWYFASSNNVLTEIEGDTRAVWIPTYHTPEWPELEATDRYNRDLWRSFGFETHALPSFHDLARDLGAARCLCKSLAR